MFPQVLKTMSAKPKAVCNVWILLLLPVLGIAAASDLRLVDAVEKGDRETARSLLNEPIDVNAAQADGATALAWAAYRDDLTGESTTIIGRKHARGVVVFATARCELFQGNGDTRTRRTPRSRGADRPGSPGAPRHRGAQFLDAESAASLHR